MIENLTELANRYKSDKGTEYGSKHGFTLIYEKYLHTLKNGNINILEIGINDGSSLKMWYDYFIKAKIIGLDIDNKRHFSNDRVDCIVIDQSKKDQLQQFVDNNKLSFNIIIDDGSHHISDQQITFGFLFPLLNSGGIYIIEDLHTSLCEPGTNVYGRPMENNIDKSNTTLSILKNKPFSSFFLNKDQNIYLENNIKDINIYESENKNVPIDYKSKSITSIIIKK
jgi:hypothetical protein